MQTRYACEPSMSRARSKRQSLYLLPTCKPDTRVSPAWVELETRESLYLLPTCKPDMRVSPAWVVLEARDGAFIYCQHASATSYNYASSFHSSSLFKELPRREELCQDRPQPPHQKPTLVFFEVTMRAFLILCLLVIALNFILQPNIFLNLCFFKLCACFL